MKFGGKQTMHDKAKTVEDRYGKTTKGTAEKPRPSTKIKPKGNPLKGKIGVQINSTAGTFDVSSFNCQY